MTVHIVPKQDIKTHDNKTDCWCKPVKLEDCGCNAVYRHNAASGQPAPVYVGGLMDGRFWTMIGVKDDVDTQSCGCS